MLFFITIWRLMKNGLLTLGRLHERALISLIPGVLILVVLFLLFLLTDLAATTATPDAVFHAIFEVAIYGLVGLIGLLGIIFVYLAGVWIIIALLQRIKGALQEYLDPDRRNSQETIICHGHMAVVTGLSWSPDGQRLTSWDADSRIYLWDTATGSQQALLPFSYPARVRLIQVQESPDGRRAAYVQAMRGRSSFPVVVLDKATNMPCAIYDGHTNAVNGLAWSPDSRRIATASADRTVHVWDIDNSGQTPFIYREHTAAVNVVAWSPDGTRIASGGDDHTVHIWRPGRR